MQINDPERASPGQSGPIQPDRERSQRDLEPVLWPALANAALWGAGSGLVNTISIVYLVRSLGAVGLGVSLIIAAPSFVGLARVGAIRFTHRGGARKRLCVGAFLASGVLLCGMPALALYADSASVETSTALAGIVGLWCGYHLLEYIGLVAFWPWLKALVPMDRMGAFIGHRGFYLDGFRAISMCAGGVWAYRFEQPGAAKIFAYAALSFCGAALLIAAAIALVFLPAAAGRDPGEPDPAPRPFRWREALTPFFDPRVAWLVAYGCWFSFFNGFTQTAQHMFLINILELNLIFVLALKSAMTLGQALISPTIGQLVDRVGNRPVLCVSQVIVGAGLAGYLFASESRPWVIGLAWLAWVAYAGINIGVPNLLLNLSPPGKTGACVAGYDAVTGLCYGLSTLAGGLMFDLLQGGTMRVLEWDLNRYQYLFYLGIVTRIMGAGWVLRIEEPRPAKSA